MATGGPISYMVTGVTPDTQFTGAATPVAGKRVAFSTTTGYEGAVFVPDGVFGDLTAVQSMIEGEVKKVAAAQGIAGTVTSP